MTRSFKLLVLSLATAATAGCTDDPAYETDAYATMRPLDAATPVYLRVNGDVNISRGYPSEDEGRMIHIDKLEGVGREAGFLRIYDATSCEAPQQTTAIFDPDNGAAAAKAGDYGLITNIQGTNYFWRDRQESPDGLDWYFYGVPANGSLTRQSDRYFGDKIVVVQSAERKNGALEPGAWRSCGVLRIK